MVYRHPHGRRKDYRGEVGRGKRVVAGLGSLTVPPPGWPCKAGMSQLCTDVSHTRTSRQALGGVGLQRGKSAAAFTYSVQQPGTVCGVRRLAPAGFFHFMQNPQVFNIFFSSAQDEKKSSSHLFSQGSE